MFEILKSGGIVMVPIIACGLVAVFIIVERFHYFFSIKKRDEKFSSDIENCILKNDFQKIIDISKIIIDKKNEDIDSTDIWKKDDSTENSKKDWLRFGKRVE